MHSTHQVDAACIWCTSCDAPDSPCHEAIEPWCRRPHGTPTTPFRLLGEPLHRFSRPPSQVSALGSPRRFGGVSWNASGPTCTRALRTRCGIEFCGPLARVRRFRCVSHQLPHGLIPTLPTVTAYLPRYHRHRSTMIRPCDPPQRASLSQPLRNRCPVLHHQHTPHQQPPPRQALLLRPYDTARKLREVSPPVFRGLDSEVLREETA